MNELDNLHEANVLTKRIYRNQLRIRDHFFTMALAIGFLVFALLTKQNIGNSIKFYLTIAIIAIIICDVLMILWHKFWIRKWRKKLTDVTGIDYTVLDNELATDNLTAKDYKKFLETLNEAEKEVLLKAQAGKVKLNLLEKGAMVSLDAKFDLYKEKHAIVYNNKLKDIKIKELKNNTKKSKKKKAK